MEKNKIFISHRHSDTQSDCHRLKSDLQEHFGGENVFLDIENLEPGINFSDAIEKALAMSKVVLVVIGPDWQGPEDSQGIKRLFQPNDWVRREVAAALKSNGTRVIPVLMKKASEPQESNLPDDLKPLASLQATEITIKRWDYDVGELMKVIERIVPKEKKQEQKPQSFQTPHPNTFPSNTNQKSWWAKNYLWALGGIIGFLILVGMCVPNEEPYEPKQDPIAFDTLKTDYIEPVQPSTSGGVVDIKKNNPERREIYEPLELEEKIPEFSGKWWLRENGIRVGYFQITQIGNEFSFTYYLFNTEVGRGTGRFDENVLYSTYFEIDQSTDNVSFAFQMANDGKSWIGQTQTSQQISEASLSRN